MIKNIIRYSTYFLLIMLFCAISDVHAAFPALRQGVGRFTGQAAKRATQTGIQRGTAMPSAPGTISQAPVTSLHPAVPINPPIQINPPIPSSPISQQPAAQSNQPGLIPRPKLSAETKRRFLVQESYGPKLESLREENHTCFDVIEALTLRKDPEWIKKIFEENKKTLEQTDYKIGFIDAQATASHDIIGKPSEIEFLKWYPVINLNAKPLFEFIRLPGNSIMYITKAFNNYTSLLIKPSTWLSGKSSLDPLAKIETIEQVNDAKGVTELKNQLKIIEKFKTDVENLQQHLPEYKNFFEEGKEILDLSPEQVGEYEQNLQKIEQRTFNTTAETEFSTQLFTELEQKVTNEKTLRAQVASEHAAFEKELADIEKLEKEVPELTEQIDAEQRKIDALAKDHAEIAEKIAQAEADYAAFQEQQAKKLENDMNKIKETEAFRNAEIQEQEKILNELQHSYEQDIAQKLAQQKQVHDQNIQKLQNDLNELESQQKDLEEQQKKRVAQGEELEQRAQKAQAELIEAQKEETAAIQARKAQEKIHQENLDRIAQQRAETEKLEKELMETTNKWQQAIDNQTRIAQEKKAAKEQFAQDQKRIETDAAEQEEAVKKEEDKKIAIAQEALRKTKTFLNANLAEQQKLMQKSEQKALQESKEARKAITKAKDQKSSIIAQNYDKQMKELEAEETLSEQKGNALKIEREKQENTLKEKYENEKREIENEEKSLEKDFQNKKNEIERRKQDATEKRALDEKGAEETLQKLEKELQQLEAQHSQHAETLREQETKLSQAKEASQKADNEYKQAEKAHLLQKKEEAQKKLKEAQERKLALEERAAAERAKLELLRNKEQTIKKGTEDTQKDVATIQEKLENLQTQQSESTKQKEQLEEQLRREEKLKQDLVEKEESLAQAVQEKKLIEAERKNQENILAKAEEQRNALAEKMQSIGTKKEAEALAAEVPLKRPIETSPAKSFPAEKPEEHIEAQQRKEAQEAAEKAAKEKEAAEKEAKEKEEAEARERQRLAEHIKPPIQEKIEAEGGDGSLPMQAEKEEDKQPEIFDTPSQKIPKMPKPPVLPEFPQKEIPVETIPQPAQEIPTTTPAQAKPSEEKKPDARTTERQYPETAKPSKKIEKTVAGQPTTLTGDPFQRMRLPQTPLTGEGQKPAFQPHIPVGIWTKANKPSPRSGSAASHGYEQPTYYEQPPIPQPEVKLEPTKAQEKPTKEQPSPEVIHEKLEEHISAPLAQRKGPSSSSWLTYLKGVMQLAKAKETQKMVEPPAITQPTTQKKANPIVSFIQNAATAIKNTVTEFFDLIMSSIKQ